MGKALGLPSEGMAGCRINQEAGQLMTLPLWGGIVC
jgi:hypothetical protein